MRAYIHKKTVLQDKHQAVGRRCEDRVVNCTSCCLLCLLGSHSGAAALNVFDDDSKSWRRNGKIMDCISQNALDLLDKSCRLVCLCLHPCCSPYGGSSCSLELWNSKLKLLVQLLSVSGPELTLLFKIPFWKICLCGKCSWVCIQISSGDIMLN